MRMHWTKTQLEEFIDSLRLSLTEVERFIYPHGPSAKTIYSWIKPGIFVPAESGEVGRGHAARLDFSDDVLCGAFHALFRLGVRFSQINIRQQRFETAQMEFHGVDDPERELGPRYWQAYFEKHRYRVMIHVVFERPLDPGRKISEIVVGEGFPPTQHLISMIYVYPVTAAPKYHPSQPHADHLDMVMATLPYESHCFTYVQYWNMLVRDRLKNAISAGKITA